ncbi:MAG: protein kinase [Holophagaceae bacterium]|nr:protein kinase [Holophagaceae bacterium]
MTGLPVPEPTLRPGQVLGRYTVLGTLGRGGMGEVYRARDNRLERIVALKLLPVRVVNDREQFLRFQNEARTLAALNHPGIVTLHAVEEEEGYHFLIMEFVEGHTLRDAIPGDGMELKDFFDVAIILADALAAAHEQGIIHRDLKPENVMFTRTGRLKVLDFGLARFEAPPEGSAAGADSPTSPLTKEGLIVGTVPYLSPEQVQGRTADHRSDIFSLGIVFFEMLAGERPFQADSPVGLMTAILRDEPLPLEELRNDLPTRLPAILRRCLEKRPEDRYPSVQDLLGELKELRSDLEAARIISASDRPVPSSPRSSEPDRATPSGRWSAVSALRGQAPLHALLAGVMAVNLVETAAETWLRETFGLGVGLGDRLAEAAQGLERGLTFDSHDMTNTVAVHGFALAYFVLFPLLAVGVAWALARRPDASYRRLAYAVALVYAISLPFFLFFPVPERWFYPESGAILLSDLWTSRFIEAFRPISGIDNCFPSFHTSLVTILVLAAFRAGLRHRVAIALLGLVVLLSTFVLGIHWLPDIAAGLAAGVLAFSLAGRLAEREARPPQAASTLDLEAPGRTGPTARLPSHPAASAPR